MTATLPRPELMAPAGAAAAGYAALHYGADAVYAGLERFSARADAENFSLTQLDELTAFAHSLTPRRRVYVTMNTLLQERELAAAAAMLGDVADIGVDAVIVQDWGVFRLARRHFPELRLHASTQLAVHNRAGVEALARRGFARVTLAREMTLAEIRDAAQVPGVEVEVFVHGALCYCYSGLCLFSSQMTGKSGNRGRCNYPCRAQTHAPEGDGLFFSMKDLALAEQIPGLAAAGVSSLKIEGRKKTPLYVAAVTSFYRDCLAGRLDKAQQAARAEEIQTIFSRLWTPLYVASPEQREVVDVAHVGHRGTPVGTVEGVREHWLRFTCRRALERHDGLQIDLPGRPRPYGFAAEELRLLPAGRSAFSVPAGSRVEVAMPPDHPAIAAGLPVYCASSQAVKQRYGFPQPAPGEHRRRFRLDVVLSIGATGLRAAGRVPEAQLAAEATLWGSFTPTQKPERLREGIDRAFGSLGPTRYAPGELRVDNPGQHFAPVSLLNELRRQLVAALDAAWEQRRVDRTAACCPPAPPPVLAETSAAPAWTLLVDRLARLDALGEEDWAALEEVIVDIGLDPLPDLLALSAHPRRERLRLALPAILAEPDGRELAARAQRLVAAGWRRWQIGNPAGWQVLGEGLDLTADWPLYVLNREAARQLAEFGLQRLTLSPEDSLENYRQLLGEWGERAQVIVYQDTPLFRSRTLSVAPGHVKVGATPCQVVHRGRQLVLLHDQPYCLAGRLGELRAAGARHLRADFAYRHYSAPEVADLFRRLRTGQEVAGRLANFDRGFETAS